MVIHNFQILYIGGMKNYLLIFFLSALAPIPVLAQDTIPHVQGKVNISVQKGTIECDLTLSNMPRLGDYYLRLNAGMFPVITGTSSAVDWRA